MLASIRIAMTTTMSTIGIEEAYEYVPAMPISNTMIGEFSAPPLATVGFPLIQACACMNVGYDYPHGLDCVYYDHRLIAMYTLGSIVSRHEWWTETDILYYFPPSLYDKEALNLANPEKRAVLDQLPFRIAWCTEERGSEIKTWNGIQLKESSLTKAGNEGFALWSE